MNNEKSLVKNNHIILKESNFLIETTDFLIKKSQEIIEYEDKFIKIKKGSFYMGSNEEYLYPEYSSPNDPNKYEKPLHHVKINYDFWITKNPITIQEYNEYLINNLMNTIEIHNLNDNYLPVTNISWNDANNYCDWRSKKESTNYRLPTEAEWEYTCRAGTDTKYFFGTNIKDLNEYAWYLQNSQNKIHKVGLKKQNPWGVNDMYGNIWEWCQDLWEDNYKYASSDGSAILIENKIETSKAVIRGGSFSNIAENIYSSFRIFEYINDEKPNIGFRIIKEET